MKVSNFADMWKTRRNRAAVYSKSQYWDAKAAEYQGDAISMWPNNHLNHYYHREQVSVISTLLCDVRGLRVLDIGCGTGRNSRYLAGRGASVLGIDFSPKAVEVARRLSGGDNPAYRVQSVFELDERKAFDAALCWGVVTVACRNRAELADALTRIGRSLKAGGRLLVCEPIHKGFLHRVLDMNTAEFLAVVKEAGFDIDKVMHLHFWPMRLALAFVRWPRVLTAAGYFVGKLAMSLCGNRAFGDYKVVYCSVKNN